MKQLRLQLAPRWFIAIAMLGPIAVEAWAQQQTNQFIGAASGCNRCHSSPTPQDIESGVVNRVCMTESTYWSGYDRHSTAYKSLTDPRGQQIGKLLGFTEKEILLPSAGCVQCHTTTIDPNQCVGGEGNSSLTEGVGCEACHGPASQWSALTMHAQYPEWRQMDSQVKKGKGWIDMSSPVVRAQVCNSCHIGSAENGRLITHDMYAAGHPPLSGFDLETFADKMPRHWRYPYELSDPTAIVSRDPAFVRTRNILVGGVVSLRTAVELAMADAAAPIESGRWPELARYDCFACHHELVEPGWRQFRQASAALGRPQIAVSSVPLVAIAAELAKDGPRETFADIMKRLQAPFEKNVFGDGNALKTEGAAVVAWCQALEDSLTKRPMDFDKTNGAIAARDLLRGIAARGKSELYDYDTNRQLLGAFFVTFDELVANGVMPTERAEELTKLLASLKDKDKDPFVLERGQLIAPCQPVPKDQTGDTPAQREKNYDTLFEKRALFNPERFSVLMASLSDVID
jgi:hypothetical protein